jgi:hypothetical protein
MLPWRVNSVIPLVAETRGGLSQKIRGLINLCATLVESNAAPGFNPKLKAELTSKFMYNIVSTIRLNNADIIFKIPQGIRHNAKRLYCTNARPGTSPLSIPIPLFLTSQARPSWRLVWGCPHHHPHPSPFVPPMPLLGLA